MQDVLRTYAARVREFSPNARLFLAAATLGGLNAGVSSVLLNLYVLSLGYGEAFLGRLLSLGALAALPAALVAGPLIDRWGGRRAMLLGTALVGGGALILLASATPRALTSGLALASMGTVLVYIAVSPFLARHSSPSERAYLFAVTAAAYVVSTAAGSAIGGFLPGLIRAIWGGLSQPDVYRLALFGGAVLSAFGIPLLALIREPVGPPVDASEPDPAAGRPSPLASLLVPRIDRHALLVLTQFVIADGLIRLGANLVVPFFNVFFVRHLGATEAWYGTLRFLERAVEVGAMLAVARFAARFGPVATVTATQLLSVPMLLTLGAAPTMLIASTAFLFRGTLMEMTVPIRDSFMMDVVPERARATANAALLLAGYVLAFFSTRIGGAMFESGQIGLAFGLTASFYVASALLYWHFFRALPQAAPGRTLRLSALSA